jgi:hypothetical protein
MQPQNCLTRLSVREDKVTRRGSKLMCRGHRESARGYGLNWKRSRSARATQGPDKVDHPRVREIDQYICAAIRLVILIVISCSRSSTSSVAGRLCGGHPDGRHVPDDPGGASGKSRRLASKALVTKEPRQCPKPLESPPHDQRCPQRHGTSYRRAGRVRR